jgi:hypothetical protein
MSRDQKYQERLGELRPLIFSLQAAIELFGRERAKEMAKLALEKYAQARFVTSFDDIPMEERWEKFRGGIIHHADDIEYSVEKVDDSMIKIKYLRCIFLEIFRDYGLEDFVPLYCDTDYSTCRQIHPGISMTRTQTLAEGASFCDHYWVYRLRNERK